MRALGKALGASRQTILNYCSAERQAEKYYQKLADIEGISLESLVEKTLRTLRMKYEFKTPPMKGTYVKTVSQE